jgi:hypothetical protein
LVPSAESDHSRYVLISTESHHNEITTTECTVGQSYVKYDQASNHIDAYWKELLITPIIVRDTIIPYVFDYSY